MPHYYAQAVGRIKKCMIKVSRSEIYSNLHGSVWQMLGQYCPESRFKYTRTVLKEKKYFQSWSVSVCRVFYIVTVYSQITGSQKASQSVRPDPRYGSYYAPQANVFARSVIDLHKRCKIDLFIKCLRDIQPVSYRFVNFGLRVWWELLLQVSCYSWLITQVQSL